jgi:hypothetical protein
MILIGKNFIKGIEGSGKTTLAKLATYLMSM